jgi:acyl-CoA thioesterase YciA
VLYGYAFPIVIVPARFRDIANSADAAGNVGSQAVHDAPAAALAVLPRTPSLVRVFAMPADANPNGAIFGGWLLPQMDLAGGSLAVQRARGRCATVAVDSMVFHQPVLVGDEVSCYGELIRTGRTSMTVRIEAWRRHLPSGEVRKVTEAVFTYVAMGEDRRPRALPTGL